MELFFVCVFFSFVLFTVGDLRKSCHPVFGAFGSSKGGSHCIPLSSYDNKHQWATCLSDSYIRQKSKGSHVCRDKDRTYCWYQCMNEVHDIDKGRVYDDCACVPEAVATTNAPTWRPKPTNNAPTRRPKPKTNAPTWRHKPTTNVPTWRPKPTTANAFQLLILREAVATTNVPTQRANPTTTSSILYAPEAVATTTAPAQRPNPITDDTLRYEPDVVATINSPTPIQDSTMKDGLPGWCYSPDGTNCDWFTDCLLRRHLCSSERSGYAVEYSSKFCKLYTKNRDNFSLQSQRWINAVRKCLQVELVPIVRPYVRTTCKEIQHKAFASYSQCYLEPYPDEPSICDLDLTDWAKVFWTIEGAFLETKIPSLKELMDSTRDCRNFVLGNIHDMRLIMLTFKKIGGHSVKKDPIETADTVTKQLAEQLLWKQHGVQWFSYVNDDTEQTDLNTRVGILLGSRSIYDVNAINTIGVPDADMDKTVDDFANAIGNEKLHLNISTDLSLVHFTACLDFDCQATYHDVTPKLSSGTANTKAHVVVIAILSSILMYLLIC